MKQLNSVQRKPEFGIRIIESEVPLAAILQSSLTAACSEPHWSRFCDTKRGQPITSCSVQIVQVLHSVSGSHRSKHRSADCYHLAQLSWHNKLAFAAHSFTNIIVQSGLRSL